MAMLQGCDSHRPADFPGSTYVLPRAYAVGNRVTSRRLVVVALATGLAQAAFAVLLVDAGVLIFFWTREQVMGMAERSLTAASYLMIGPTGLYLAQQRSLASLWRPHPRAICGPSLTRHGAT
jgi:nickel/cobalt transporter (NicO) family protein